MKESVPSLRIRRATAADIPAMMGLESHSLTAAHWSRQQYESLFASTGQLQLECFALIAHELDEIENRIGSGAIVENESILRLGAALSLSPSLVGFLVARKVDTEWELDSIVVAEGARRRGVGTLLLSELVGYARSEGGSALFLEVRESNQSARALYMKMGFEQSGVRNNYYASPPESAILYRLKLS